MDAQRAAASLADRPSGPRRSADALRPETEAPAVKRRQPVVMTAVKALSFTVSMLLFGAVAVGIAGALTRGTLAPAAIGLLIGYLGADLLSGSVHWFCDTFFDEDTPLIGRTVIWPFRDHHRHPSAIAQYRLLEQDGTSYFILIPPLWMAWRSGAPDANSAIAVLADAALCGFAFGAFCTNVFHKWAHSACVPVWGRWLQHYRLILSPGAHDVHHRAYTGGYCVTSGWLNTVLDAVDFFGRAERVIRWLLRRLRPAAGIR
jgi:ubiquitin-conjugating enzyme E2 variant